VITGQEKISARELAAVLSLTSRHVRRLASENVLTSEPSPKGQLFVLATAVSEFLDYEREEESTTPEGEQLKRTRRELLEIEKGRKAFLFAQERREFVSTAAVIQVHGFDYSQVRQSLAVLKARLFERFPDPGIRRMIEQELEVARVAMSDHEAGDYFADQRENGNGSE
jgi:hypothetical protein